MRQIIKAGLAIAIVAASVSACGSSSSPSRKQATSSGSVAVPASGPGYTQPTAPTGARVSGGTVYFTEGADATPNYIFPMYSPQVCSVTNSDQLMDMMYRPLYWYGNDYRPTIDYDDSIGEPPKFSNADKTVTIHLRPWKWSNGETVTSRDLVLWMNVMKASPATEWCGYVPGYFPDNVVSYSAPNPSTFVLTFNKAYDQEWLLYSELSQLTPLPLAWDRTSLKQPAPTSDTGHLPDSTKAGAASVYAFLNAQAKDLSKWATSALWQVVDGPFHLQSFTSTGEVTLVPNRAYSGAPKPAISRLVELPFTSEAALENQLRAAGTKAITIGNLPSQYAPQASALVGQGYTDNRAASYSFNYFPLNFNSNAPTSPGHEPVRFVFRQLYFRQALQHLVDQNGWIDAFLNKTASPTYGPVPPAPPSPLVSVAALSENPYPFSVAAAASLLRAHGWKVVPGGTTTCAKPGTAAGECGAGIAAGEGIAFTIDYLSGVVSVQSEMNDLAASAKRVGIDITLTTHPFASVISTAVACHPAQATCKWTAQNWGAGWIYGPSYLPTGEQLYAPGAVANYGSYNDPSTTKLITATLTGPVAQESQALTRYARNVEEHLPVVFGPTSVGTYGGYAGTLIDRKLGGYAANALGFMNPEDWYFTK